MRGNHEVCKEKTIFWGKDQCVKYQRDSNISVKTWAKFRNSVILEKGKQDTQLNKILFTKGR